jgi:hypothetical protein
MAFVTLLYFLMISTNESQWLSSKLRVKFLRSSRDSKVMAQTVTCQKLKIFYSNNGGKYSFTKFLRYCTDNGTFTNNCNHTFPKVMALLNISTWLSLKLQDVYFIKVTYLPIFGHEKPSRQHVIFWIITSQNHSSIKPLNKHPLGGSKMILIFAHLACSLWVHVHILIHQCGKMDAKTSKCILLGWDDYTKGIIVIVHLLVRSSFLGSL